MAIAEVILWGKRIGAVTDDFGDVEFSYDEDFLKSGIELAPLALPLNRNIYSFPELRDVKPYYGLPGLLADSLPDSYGNLMISEYLGRYGNGRTVLSPVEKLCYTGTRGMGALEYKPVFEQAQRCSNINLAELTKLAELVLTKRNELHICENENAMKQLLQVGSSAGGARAKALIAWNESTKEICSGQIDAGPGFGYWLLKFDRMTNNLDKEIKPDDIDATRIEYAYYLMATKAGIKMSESRLYPDGDCAHFITKRFDRTDTGKKIHMVSLCGMNHMNFRDCHVYDYVNIADTVDRLGLGKKGLEEISRRMVFNDMVYNFDDHVKNTSFLMNQQGEWSLSPAYDMTFAFDKDGRFTNSHQVLINGKSLNVERTDYLACGKMMGLSTNRMNGIIEQIKESVTHFDEFAMAGGVREERLDYISHLLKDKIEHL